ncbi:carboxypeptidase-like regulatory domain-containing protein [Novipirellula artificiosorum]|uniref:Uncharacterized protein n=1 Tax=Novipirellula artificiosorum TaxID=2528016 RepID=A0A5C6DR91_9BACT|nr:carboxypeptidase-like regulatory domain-containing protein [Novipirellula artificiosorum]TWU38387.1 hypothetical protein Poly41_28630 [Novipirellula artificiosorum]
MRMLVMIFVVAFGARVSGDSPFLEGRVTDQFGRPIESATVTIMDCLGTCWGGASRVTAIDGTYVFDHRTFRNMPLLTVSMPGRYHVSTDYRGPGLSDQESDQPRQADFVLGTPAAVTVHVDETAPSGWTQTVLLRPGRDVALHRYDITGRHNQGWATWSFDLVPRFETYHVVVVHQPTVEPIEDPKELRKRKRESNAKRIETLSPGIRFVDPQRYTVKLELTPDDAGDGGNLSLISIVDVLNQDRTLELSEPDPLFGPTVGKAMQQEALQLIERIAKAASPWNARPPKSIRYQYDAVLGNSEPIHVLIDKDSPLGPAWADISRLRGFAYMPPLRWLFSQPENLLIHGFQVDDNRVVLVYRLKQRRGFSAGIGIGPSWSGFFSRSFSAGRLVIDPKRAVVLEHRFSLGPLGEESIESFEDYVAVEDGFAPRRMRIQSGDFDFRLRFKLHQDRLWLLEQASHGEAETPALRIENVSVELQPLDSK